MLRSRYGSLGVGSARYDMNIFELIIFLAVTAAIGAGVGSLVGFFGPGIVRGAQLGAFAGPVVAGIALSVYSFIARRQKTQRGDQK